MTLLKKILSGTLVCFALTAAAQNVKITCNYPGGNVKVIRTAPGIAEIAPDLRDTSSYWFYWNFDAESDAPGKVRFLFPEKRKTISAQGPCISTDGGKTWRWLGKDKTKFIESAGNTEKRDSFEWEFTKGGEKVRFAHGFPYQKADFDRFVAAMKNNPHLQQTFLTKTRKGAESPMLVIGKADKTKKAFLLTARHHACEAIASFVWEGFVEEALSDSPCGVRFREKYVLYAVPFVDLDGVEAGDQGKNRAPHDHNRDYGLEKPLYPEIAALMNLCREKKFFAAMDLHAPSVRTDIHEAFYLAGLKTPENQKISNVFLSWLHREIPPQCSRTLHLGGKNAMQVEGDRGIAFSSYFQKQEGMAYAMTIENPYASSNILYDSAAAKEYGRGVCRAIVRTEISGRGESEGLAAAFQKLEKDLSNGGPHVILKNAQAMLDDSASAAIFKNQARLQRVRSLMRLRKNAEALEICEKIFAEKDVLLQQKYEALTMKTELLCRMNSAMPEDWLRVQEQMKIGGDYGFRIWDAFYANASARKDVPAMLKCAEKQLIFAPRYHVGKIRNRIAHCYLAAGDKEKAAAYSRVTIQFLNGQLFPDIPVGVFGPNQLLELVHAQRMVPETPRAEILKTIGLCRAHKLCNAFMQQELDRIEKALNAEK